MQQSTPYNAKVLAHELEAYLTQPQGASESASPFPTSLSDLLDVALLSALLRAQRENSRRIQLEAQERAILEKAAPALIRETARASLPLALVHGWWQYPGLVKWMNQRSEYELKRLASLEPSQTQGLLRLTQALRVLLEAQPAAWGVWISQLLRAALTECGQSALEAAVPELERVLLLTTAHQPRVLASEVVAALKRTHTSRQVRLITLAFPIFYPSLHAGKTDFISTTWYRFFDWDKAKGWRHWLLETWLEQGLPTGALLQILTCHEELARKVLKRAAKLEKRRLLEDARRQLEHPGSIETALREPDWAISPEHRARLLRCLKELGY